MGYGAAADGAAGSPTPYHCGKHARLAPRSHETQTAFPELLEAAFRQGRGKTLLHAPGAANQFLPGARQIVAKGFGHGLLAPPGVVENPGVLRRHDKERVSLSLSLSRLALFVSLSLSLPLSLLLSRSIARVVDWTDPPEYLVTLFSCLPHRF